MWILKSVVTEPMNQLARSFYIPDKSPIGWGCSSPKGGDSFWGAAGPWPAVG